MSTSVEIRRNAGLSAAVGLAAGVMAIAYLDRASGSGHGVDWLLCFAMAAIALVQLMALVDARTPLLIADEQGVRVRLGPEWLGLPWEALEQVVVEQRDTPVRDGRLVLVPRSIGSALEDLDSAGRRQVALQRRLYGAPLAVPLSVATRCSTRQPADELTALAAGRADIVAVHGREKARIEEPSADARRHGRGDLGTLVSRLAGGRDHDIDKTGNIPVVGDEAAPGLEVEAGLDPLDAPPIPVQRTRSLEEEIPVDPVSAAREARPVTRAEIFRDARPRVGVPPADERAAVVPVGAAAPIDEFAATPAVDPVIGPEIAAARTRARLSIEELSERTRIRPHVLEALEVDDFGPCGGDFYARGHLRTLARYLALDADELLATYDERYSHAPINARRVFEAELATGMGGGIRATTGGPRWSLLVGATLALLMIWGVARFFTATPVEVASPSPDVSDSAGLTANHVPITSKLTQTTTLTLRAVGGKGLVTVKDRTGYVIWSGTLFAGESRQVAGVAPFTVNASNGPVTRLMIAGKKLGPVGTKPGQATRKVG